MKLGVIDSGVGGLSVLPHLTASMLPLTELVYVADTAWMPYGCRTPDELRPRVGQLIDWLVTHHGVQAIALACNTATTIALKPENVGNATPFNAFDAMQWLRTAFAVPVVSPVFPTVEWMAYQLAHGHIPNHVVLWATETTVNSTLYQRALADFAQHTMTVTSVSGGPLAARVETHDLSESDELIQSLAHTINAAGSPVSLIMGCTHYPHAWHWLAPHIITAVTLVNPAEHLSAKLQAILGVQEAMDGQAGNLVPPLGYRFFATGDVHAFATTARVLLPHLPWPHITVEPMVLTP